MPWRRNLPFSISDIDWLTYNMALTTLATESNIK